MHLRLLVVAFVLSSGLAAATPADAASSKNLGGHVTVKKGKYYCFGAKATIVSTNGDDHIKLTPANDVVVSLGGNDVIEPEFADQGASALEPDASATKSDAYRSRDRVCTGPGNDQIQGMGRGGAWKVDGGTGDDTIASGREIYGDAGNDTIEYRDCESSLIRGGSGNDVIRSGYDTRVKQRDGFQRCPKDDDVVYGDDDHDVIYGGDGNDKLYGGPGHDYLVGQLGANELRGWAGDDTLIGERSPDGLDGGSGKDSCLGGGGSDEYVKCELLRVFSNLGPGDSFYRWGSRSATTPNRGYPPMDADLAMGFEVPAGRDFSLESLDIALSFVAGANTFDLFLTKSQPISHQWGGFQEEPNLSSSGIIESWRVHDRLGNPDLVHVESATNAVLEAGQRYWVVLSVPEPNTEVRWHSDGDYAPAMIAERFSAYGNKWESHQATGGFALRVTSRF